MILRNDARDFSCFSSVWIRLKLARGSSTGLLTSLIGAKRLLVNGILFEERATAEEDEAGGGRLGCSRSWLCLALDLFLARFDVVDGGTALATPAY